MHSIGRFLFIVIALAVNACRDHQPQTELSECSPTNIKVVPARPDSGFQYPYILRFPDCDSKITPYLLVEPNNTGKVSDDLEIHLEAAKLLAQESSVGSFVAEYLNAPLLVPAFPRSEIDWEVYTHALDRDSLLISSGPVMRIDMQLIAMIEHAKKELLGTGITVFEQALFTGFSASGTFVNRFTALHPEIVHAVAAGGLNGIAIVPRDDIDGQILDYPLGVHDISSFTGQAFQRDRWLNVPQYLYMGENDKNEAVEYDDGYSESERRIVYQVIGKKMQPDRWLTIQAIYESDGAMAKYKTYEGIGHGTNQTVRADVAEFFRSMTSN